MVTKDSANVPAIIKLLAQIINHILHSLVVYNIIDLQLSFVITFSLAWAHISDINNTLINSE